MVFFFFRLLLEAVLSPPLPKRMTLTLPLSSLVQELPPLESQDLVLVLDLSSVPSLSDTPVIHHWNNNSFHTPFWVSPCLKLWVFSVLWWPFCFCSLFNFCVKTTDHLSVFKQVNSVLTKKSKCTSRRRKTRKDNFDPQFIGLDFIADSNIFDLKVKPTEMSFPCLDFEDRH